MSSAFDGFGDIVEEELGLFGGRRSALAQIDSIKTKPAPQGVQMELYCRGCGKGIVMTLEYPEVIGMQFGLPPQAWIQGGSTWEAKPEYDGAGNQVSAPSWRPVGMQCPCGFHFPIRIALDEPKGWVGRAVASNFIRPEEVQRLSSIALQHARAKR